MTISDDINKCNILSFQHFLDNKRLFKDPALFKAKTWSLPIEFHFYQVANLIVISLPLYFLSQADSGVQLESEHQFANIFPTKTYCKIQKYSKGHNYSYIYFTGKYEKMGTSGSLDITTAVCWITSSKILQKIVSPLAASFICTLSLVAINTAWNLCPIFSMGLRLSRLESKGISPSDAKKIVQHCSYSKYLFLSFSIKENPTIGLKMAKKLSASINRHQLV